MGSERMTALWNQGYRDAVALGIADPFITEEEAGPYYEGFAAGRLTVEAERWRHDV